MSRSAKPSAVPVASRLFGDCLIMMITPCVMAWYYNGERALRVMLASIAASVLTEVFAGAVFKTKADLKNPAAVFTGLAIALMMPAAVPYYVPVLACVFAVLVVRIPFGGELKSPFVPAAAGFAFASICFGKEVFTYVSSAVPSSGKYLGGTSLAALLRSREAIHLNLASSFDIISGNVAGPMGTTCTIVMIGCAVYLLIRRPKALLVTLGVITGAAVMALAFPRASISSLTSLYLELCSGSLLFAAVFLATDPATMPRNNLFRLIYGLYTGVLCMLMRFFGAYEECACFAVLLANATWPVLHGFLTDAKYALAVRAAKSASNKKAKEAAKV